MSFLANIFTWSSFITPGEKQCISYAALQTWKFFFTCSKAIPGFTVILKVLQKDVVDPYRTPLYITYQEISHISAFSHPFLVLGYNFKKNSDEVKYSTEPGDMTVENDLPRLLYLKWLFICWTNLLYGLFFFFTYILPWLKKPGREIME